MKIPGISVEKKRFTDSTIGEIPNLENSQQKHPYSILLGIELCSDQTKININLSRRRLKAKFNKLYWPQTSNIFDIFLEQLNNHLSFLHMLI